MSDVLGRNTSLYFMNRIKIYSSIKQNFKGEHNLLSKMYPDLWHSLKHQKSYMQECGNVL